RVLPAPRMDRGRRAGGLRGPVAPADEHLPADARARSGRHGAASGRDHFARPVTAVADRSRTTARRPRDRTATSAESSIEPTTAAASPRAWNAATHSFSRPGGQHSEKETAGKHGDQATRPPPGGRGNSARSTVAPRPLHSSSIASEPMRPAMLTSLAATQAPDAAIAGSNRTSPAIRSARRSNERKNGKSGRITPSRHAATTSDWPSPTRVDDSTAPARPIPKADRAGTPVWIVRWPPTSGTSYQAAASLIPRNAARARSALPTTVSTMPSGVAPIAAKSFTFVRTAAIPAP